MRNCITKTWHLINSNDDLPKGLGRDVNIVVDLKDGKKPIASCGYWNANRKRFEWDSDMGDAIETSASFSAKVIAWCELPQVYINSSKDQSS